MNATLKYDFCEIQIFDNYLIAEMFEGIHLTPNKNDILLNISTKYFKNKNFGYITNRINSYSVDPSIYIETSKIENLVSFAIVSTKQINISNSQVEKLFFKKPFKQFNTLNQAVSWTEGIINKFN